MHAAQLWSISAIPELHSRQTTVITVVLTEVAFVELVELVAVVTMVLVVAQILQSEGQKEQEDPLRKYPGTQERQAEEVHTAQPSPQS